jgi:large subunit ribosomal protein L18
MALSKRERRIRIKKRIRKKINGTNEIPRLSVFRSNKHISVQLIDDVTETTLLAVASSDKDFAGQKVNNKIEMAGLVGKKVAEKAISKNISTAVFDRNGYLYHGRVKAVAEAARNGGLKL